MNIPREILHIDDDPALLRLVASRLKPFDIRVVSLTDPTEVPEFLLKSDIRVGVFDIDMPQMSGLELLRQIKEQDGGIQVIMLTGVVSMSSVLRSLRWGAEACLFKPVTEIEPLVLSIESALAKVQRWWLALQELKQRQADGGSDAVLAPSAFPVVHTGS